MGNRRMGAQRMNALLKRGSTGTDSSYQAGAAAAPMIVSHNIRREGKLVITEIAIDLGGNGSGTIASGAVQHEPIGLKSSTLGAQLMIWEADVHGTFLFAEAVVLETANTETAVSLRSGTAQEAPDETIAGSGAVLAGIAVNALGITTSRDMDGVTAETTLLADGEYLYLTNDTNSSAVDFTQGRLIVRLVGADNSWTF